LLSAVSRRLSACRRSLLGHPVPAEALGLPCGRLTGHTLGRVGPQRGCHVPHEPDTTGVGALSTPRTVVLTRPETRLRPAPAASQRPVLAPHLPHPIPVGLPLTRHHRGFTGVHPSGLPLHLWPLDGTAALGLDHLSFAPRRYQRRTSGWGQASSTDLSYTFDIVDLQSVQLLNSCDFVSHLTTGTMAWLRSPRISADPTCWRPSRRRSLTGGQTDRVKTTT